MPRISTSTDLSTGATQIVFEYNGVDDESGRNSNFNRKFYPRLQYNSRAIHFDAKDSLFIDLSTSATQSAVKYNKIDEGDKLVKKLSKSWKIVKKFKKPQKSEKSAKTIGSEECLLKH